MDNENTQNKTELTEPLSPTAAAVHSQTAREFPPRRSPLTRTQHDSTWYGIPGSVWPGGVSLPGCAPSWSPVKINPVLAKPRTNTEPVLKYVDWPFLLCTNFLQLLL